MFGPSKTKAGREGGYFICFEKNCCGARSVALRQHLDGTSSTVVANASTARPRACGFSATPSDDLVFIFLRELIDANVIPQPLSNRTAIVRVARSLAPFHLWPESGRDRFSVPGLRNHQIFNIFLSRNMLHGQFVAHTTTKEVELRIPNSANYWPLSSTWRPILTYHKVLDTTKSPELGQIVVDRDRRKRDISDHARRPRQRMGYCDAGWHPVIAVAEVRCVPNLDVLARRADVLLLTPCPGGVEP